MEIDYRDVLFHMAITVPQDQSTTALVACPLNESLVCIEKLLLKATAERWAEPGDSFRCSEASREFPA
jgi:hypothetical protein